LASIALPSPAARAACSRLPLTPYLLVAPAAGLLALFVYWPIAHSIWLSLHAWDFLRADAPFVGLANYRDLLASGEARNSLRVTVLFVLLSVPPRLLLALLLALALVRETPFRRGVRAAVFLPVVTSSVAVAIVWSWLLATDGGLVNLLLTGLGLARVPWLTSTETAIVALALVAVWKQLGYDLVIYIAGLKAIPPEYREAAALDGAGFWAGLRFVTLPLLMPTTLFLLVIAVVDSFQTFTLVNVLTQGGPAFATDLLVNLLYRVSFVYFDIGRGAALAILLLLLLLGLTWLKLRVVGRRVHYEGG
jgi:multiple sugar transport system permease protein/sn-glycerol 3-phosphate transport system permease protein